MESVCREFSFYINATPVDRSTNSDKPRITLNHDYMKAKTAIVADIVAKYHPINWIISVGTEPQTIINTAVLKTTIKILFCFTF